MMIAHDTPAARILIADGDRVAAGRIADLIAAQGFNVETAYSVFDALERIGHGPVDVVLADDRLAGGGAIELLHVATRRDWHTAFVVTSARPTVARAVAAMKLGAHDYFHKPVQQTELFTCLDRVLARQSVAKRNPVRVEDEARSDAKYRTGFPGVVGNDFRMLRALEIVETVALTNVTVLLQGASGTGKSLIARALHDRSERRDGPFVEVSCGALPETLLESELFGHVRGAFTGAIAGKSGRFQVANGGTVFLDEVSAACSALQLKLLRVLQSQQFEPVGSNETQTVDARVILATNLDLEAEMTAGRFREDLFYRINVVTIDLPSLADRLDDVPRLARYFLARAVNLHKRRVYGIAEEAMQRLCAYGWPGNVRELENAIERGVVLCKGHVLTVDDLPPRVRTERRPTRANGRYHPMPLKDALAEPERQFIEAALRANGWNRRVTAEQLAINRTTLYKKMKRYGLNRDSLS